MYLAKREGMAAIEGYDFSTTLTIQKKENTE